MPEAATPDLGALAGDLDGELVLPSDSGFDTARSAWNLSIDQHPAAVVFPSSPADVALAIGAAAATGLQVAPQGTGHGVGGRGDLGGAILLRTERLDGIEIDPSGLVGSFGAGVIWRDALAAASEHGLAGPSGSSPDVGVAGYLTGGGLGWLGRKYGLACNRVRAFELITAAGETVRADAETEPDLFWALRGGGGGYAVITAVELELIELAEVFAGTVIYAADERTHEIVHGYADWAAAAPEEVTSIVRFLQLPPLDQIPEPLRARPLVTIGACHAGAVDDGERLVAPLRAFAEPLMDTFAAIPPAGLVGIHMDPEQPSPGITDQAMLGALPTAAIDAFIEAAGPRSGSPLISAELRQAGGALARSEPGAGAMAELDAAFVFNGVGMPTPELASAIPAALDRIRAALAPWSTGRLFANFADRPTPADQLYDAETLARLREIKAVHDPDDVIRGAHSLAVD